MKNLIRICILIIVAAVYSCDDPYKDETFAVYDMQPISSYLSTRPDDFSEWIKVMKYADMFARVKGMLIQADVSDITEHLAYQFNITGEAEGIFYVEVKEGKLYVEPYEYFDRDAIFTCSAETLFKLAEGKTDPILAFTTGKLKVEGNIDKALRLKEIIDSKKA